MAAKVFSLLGSLYQGAHDYLFPVSDDTTKRRRVGKQAFEVEEKAVEWDEGFDPHTWTIKTPNVATDPSPPPPPRSSSYRPNSHQSQAYDSHSPRGTYTPYSGNDRYFDPHSDDYFGVSSLHGDPQLPEELCLNIHSLLKSGLVNMGAFAEEYGRTYGHDLDHRAYGYSSLGALLSNVPGVSRFAKHGFGDHVALDSYGDSGFSVGSNSTRKHRQPHRERPYSPPRSRSPRSSSSTRYHPYPLTRSSSTSSLSSSASSASAANSQQGAHHAPPPPPPEKRRSFFSHFTPRGWLMDARTGAPTDPSRPTPIAAHARQSAAAAKHHRRDTPQSQPVVASSHARNAPRPPPYNNNMMDRIHSLSQPTPERHHRADTTTTTTTTPGTPTPRRQTDGKRSRHRRGSTPQHSSNVSFEQGGSPSTVNTSFGSATQSESSFSDLYGDDAKIERTASEALRSFFGGISLHNERMDDDRNDHGNMSDDDDEDDRMRDVDDDDDVLFGSSSSRKFSAAAADVPPPSYSSEHSSGGGGSASDVSDSELHSNLETNRRRTTYCGKPDPKHARTAISPAAAKSSKNLSKPPAAAASHRRRSTPYSNNVNRKHARTSVRPTKGKKRARDEDPNTDAHKQSNLEDRQPSRAAKSRAARPNIPPAFPPKRSSRKPVLTSPKKPQPQRSFNSPPRSHTRGIAHHRTPPPKMPSLAPTSRERRTYFGRRSMSGVVSGTSGATSSGSSRRATLPAKKLTRVHGWDSDFSSAATSPRAAGPSVPQPRKEGVPPSHLHKRPRNETASTDAETSKENDNSDEKKAEDEFNKYKASYDKVMAKVEPLLDTAKHLVVDFENSRPLKKQKKVETKLLSAIDSLSGINVHLDGIQRVPTQECILKVLKHPKLRAVYTNISEWRHESGLYAEDHGTKHKRKTYVNLVLGLQKTIDDLYQGTFGKTPNL